MHTEPSTTPPAPAIENHVCRQCDEIATALNSGFDQQRFVVWHDCESGRPVTRIWPKNLRINIALSDGDNLREQVATAFRLLADEVAVLLAAGK